MISVVVWHSDFEREQEMKSKYNYIVIEGNIGAGKTSLAQMIAKTFDAKLVLEKFTDNPFLPKFYKDPGRYSFSLELSFLADRYKQLKNEIGHLNMFSPFTVADFYFMKSIVFASATLAEDEFNLYRQLFQIIYNSLPKPDLYIYLHVEPDKLMENIASRGRDYEEAITVDYLKKIQESYFNYFKQNPEYKYLILDTNQIDFVNNKLHFNAILEIIFDKHHQNGLNRAILE